MLDTIRLNLKAAMLLLIAGESLAATVGLGYRIFVVRRYVAMDIIIPYVLWMTGLLFPHRLVHPVGDPQALCLGGQVSTVERNRTWQRTHISSASRALR